MRGRSCSAAPAPRNAWTRPGKLVTSVRVLPREQWAVLIPGHHPGYISWETYEANTARLRANWRPPRGHGGGAPRGGAALLQGLLRCGRCGRIMQTGYSGPKGNSPRYVCARAKQLYATERGCCSIGGGRLEKTILAELFAVLEPAALEATAKALAEADEQYQRRLAAFELAAERARYEACRAQRQYDTVEPENRLVARTLERAWEDKLAAVRKAENDLRKTLRVSRGIPAFQVPILYCNFLSCVAGQGGSGGGCLAAGPLPDLFGLAAGLAAAQGDDGVGAGHGPSHAGQFEALADDGLASRLDHAGADEQAADLNHW